MTDKMNFNKKKNVFNDIPGFDASKGERIVKALQKLWEKVEYLEQVRVSGRKSRSDISSKNKEEDLTITDVQYKLLVLQLQYARSLLVKKHSANNTVFQGKMDEGNQREGIPASDKNYPNTKELNQKFVTRPVSQEFQIGSNIGADNFSLPAGYDNTKSATDAKAKEDSAKQQEHPSDNLTSLSQKVFPSGSKPHYHLKLDDVPFILGASSTASHSVIANVQNIIAKMKSHNKALCGPKQHATRSTTRQPVPRAHSLQAAFAGGDSRDNTIMMNQLTKDLCELAAKQRALVKNLDAVQEKETFESNLTKNVQNKKSVECQRAYRNRSNSESDVKLCAKVKNNPKAKDRNFVKCAAPQKQCSSISRNQPSNNSIMDRRKLLRSLQNFKTHLSEEDISWD